MALLAAIFTGFGSSFIDAHGLKIEGADSMIVETNSRSVSTF
jgi:hypothetical protein